MARVKPWPGATCNFTVPTDEKMSGIAGFVGRNHSLARGNVIQEMLGSMNRERACAPAIVSFPEFRLELGWLSPAKPGDDCVCVRDEANDFLILFRGEHFSDDQRAGESANGKEHGNCTATSLLDLYKKLGADLFPKLNGYFSGVIVDRRKDNVVLFNDRYGQGRIYYHDGPDGLYFSSEAKALLKVLPSLRQLDSRSVGEFLSCDCVLQDRTLFRGVSILPAGSAWKLGESGNFEERRYFDPKRWEDQPRLSPERYHESMRKLFPKVLKRYLQSPVGVAMSLTGGLDGRLVMAWSRCEPGDLPCYAFGSCFGETADVRIAGEVASVCKQPYTVFTVEGEFFSQFPGLAEETIRLSDGAMDVTGAAELYVNRLARNIRPVRLTGNYGSEILRSNVAFRPRQIFEPLFDGDLIQAVRQAETTYAEELRGNRRSFIAFKQVPWHHFARSAVEKSQLTVRTPYLDNDLVALSFQAPDADQTNFDICLKLVADGNSELAAIPTDRGVRFGSSRLLNRWRESKERILARAEYAYDYGMPNWLARLDRLLSPFRLERVFLGRQKFCHFRTWYRGRLASYVREILLDPRSLGRPYLCRREVEGAVARHLQGQANFTTEIHKLLTLELTQRLLLEGT